jgi:hypothetical protein
LAPDPFVVVAAGRAAFRAEDLVQLADLVSAYLAAVHVCVPKTSSTSCDQAIFVDQASDVSLFPDVLGSNIRS